MVHPSRLCCALAIGGNDPGGGAGVAADMRAFAAAGVFGCAAVAVITFQSTAGLTGSRVVAAKDLVAQIQGVVRHQRVTAIKIGALGSRGNVRAMGAWLLAHPRLPVVVDPVMHATRGRGAKSLLARDALHAMRATLAPRATLVTANAPEAAALTGAPVTSVAEARAAAVAICALGARAALVKGGHLRGREAVDVLAFRAPGARVVLLRAPRLRLRAVHGGGCTLASLVAGRLAKDAAAFARSPDAAIVRAVRWAKRVHHAALARAVDVGGPMLVLVP